MLIFDPNDWLIVTKYILRNETKISNPKSFSKKP